VKDSGVSDLARASVVRDNRKGGMEFCAMGSAGGLAKAVFVAKTMLANLAAG
jgi:hypothetical protein